MTRRRPERDLVENLLKENRRRKAHDIAEEVGLIETMGYDKAVDYVRHVRKSMKIAGAFPQEKYKFASDSERLEDITKLFELRQGKKLNNKVAYLMLLLNCYYRLRSEDDDIHIMAIDDTYAKNTDLVEPLEMRTAIQICEIALERYMDSIDETKKAAAIKRVLPGSGFSYASETLITKLEITDEELQHMKSIRRG
ncbi:MAG: hypothetical protein ACI4PO_03845 [Faecousia sp.]